MRGETSPLTADRDYHSHSRSRAVDLDDVADGLPTDGAQPAFVLFDGSRAVKAHAHVSAHVQHAVHRLLTTHGALVTRLFKRPTPYHAHGRRRHRRGVRAGRDGGSVARRGGRGGRSGVGDAVAAQDLWLEG